MMTRSYLARRGKKRFCDKSLGSARFSELLLRIYPGAKFICLYRHPMDMIRSGIDASPWGLKGYGFDYYADTSPGNSVLALARYWVDHAAPIIAVEEQYPTQCHRVRYEDLVTDTEKVAQELYAFIGVEHVPGIAETIFSVERERFGPSDFKIWATSRINADSIGSGESIPAGLIPPTVTTSINDLTQKLGYRPIDEDWGTPGRLVDPRRPETVSADAELARATVGGPGTDTDLLAQRLYDGIECADEHFTSRWDPFAADKFQVVARSNDAGGSEEHWLVDLDAKVITHDSDDEDDAQWSIVGSPETWQAVLSGRINLHVALRRFDLRYCSAGPIGPFDTEKRIAMLAELTGLSSWQPSSQRDPTAGPQAIRGAPGS